MILFKEKMYKHKAHIVLVAILSLFKSLILQAADESDLIQNKKVYDMLGSRSFISSIEDIVTKFKKDIPSIVAKTDKTIITGYTQSENLSASFKNYTLKKLEEASVGNKPSFNIIQCLECLSLRVEMIRGQTHIKKGVTNLQELGEHLEKYAANSYTEINLSYIGSDLILQVTIFNGVTKNILFSSEYKTKVYSHKEEGLIFGLSGLFTGFNGKPGLGAALGGKLYLGHRMPSIGEVGAFVSAASMSNKQFFLNAGIFFDLDINDITDNYWTLGILYLTNRFGTAMYKEEMQLSYAAGLKLSIFTTYHLFADYQFNFKLGSKPPKTTDDFLENNKKPMPQAVVIGFGFDFG